MPAPIGSPALVKMMGMVVVAGLRRLSGLRAETRYDHIRICCHKFGGEHEAVLETVQARLDQHPEK